jgi:hypothetical protein
MFEMIFALAAAMVVFGLFFLVFFIKQKSAGRKIHTCAQCNCERNKIGPQHNRPGWKNDDIKGDGESLHRGERYDR